MNKQEVLEKYNKEEDIIVIRGKGKFKILSKQGTTKTGKILLKIEKYK